MTSNRKWIVQNLFVTGIVMVAQLLLSIVLVRMIVAEMGVGKYGEFQIARQVAYFTAIMVTAALTPTLVRALARNRLNIAKRVGISAAGFSIVVFSSSILLCVYAFQPQLVGYLVFGDRNVELGKSVILLIVAQSSYLLAYSYLRGRHFIGMANFLQLTLYALLPVLIILYQKGQSVTDFMLLLAVLMIVGNILIFAGFLVADMAKVEFGRWRTIIVPEGMKLLRYGSKRALFPLSFGSLTALGPVILYHEGLAEEAGLFLVSMVSLRLLQPVFSTLQIVLLPKLSEIHAQKQVESMRRFFSAMVVLVVSLSTFLAGQAIAFVYPLIELVSGISDPSVAFYARLLFLSLPFSAFFFIAHSTADAISVRPVATVFSFVAAIVNAVLCWGFVVLADWGSAGIAVAYVIANAVLALAMLNFLLSQTKSSIALKDILLSILLAMSFGYLSFLLAGLLGSGLVIAGLIVAFVSVLYIVCSAMLDLVWLSEIKKIVAQFQ